MAQSTRPSASRTQSSSALPSPRNSSEKLEKTEKKPSHHVRRKSGKDYPVAERKRPAILPRRNTPQTTPRVGAVSNSKSKERERCDVEKDNGESFPQFWYVHLSDDPPSWDSRMWGAYSWPNETDGNKQYDMREAIYPCEQYLPLLLRRVRIPSRLFVILRIG
jgi:hypothetical protein